MKLKPFDKYEYYLNAVQSPEADAEFLEKVYRELRGRKASVLREDFCGTFSISCEWVKRDSSHRAVGVDLDPEPLRYGRKHYYTQLNESQKSRIEIIEDNVLNPELPKADMVAVFNFSSFFLTERKVMVSYFEKCFKRLQSGGLMVIDAFGGPMCEEPNVDETKHRGFTYFWEQASFEPITRSARFYIHFKRKGERRRDKQFEYNWRMWTLPELRDVMKDAGFKRTHIYWEGTNKRGEGNGKYSRRQKGEVCGAWVAYVVGEK